MGDRNNLHVCQHCGVVHATSSATGPKRCVVCDAFTFSEHALNDLLAEGTVEPRPERPERIAATVGRS
jgi:hypothetical protein